MVAAAIAGVLVSAAGAIYSGMQQKQAADYNAKVAENQAQSIQNKAMYEEQIHRERVRKILSAQRSVFGASGLDTASGSPLLVREDSAMQGEMDAMAIRYGGDVEAANARSAANLYRMQGRTAQTAGFIQAGGSLLSGGAQVYRDFGSR